jgi:hypothetical protein
MLDAKLHSILKRLTLIGSVVVVGTLLALPSAPVPTAAPLAASLPTDDKDGDGYTAAEEQAIFGDAGRDRLRCGTDSWPSDLSSDYAQAPDTANRITIVDVGSFVSPQRRLETNPGDAGFDARWDLNPGPTTGSTWIDISDIVALSHSEGNGSAHPPMFGAERTWNGEYCSASVPFFKKATTPFDSYAADPASWAATSNARYRGMLMYPPASDTHHAWYKGDGPNEGFFYRNAGGIEVAGSLVPGVSAQHALRDAQGNLCYLPYPSGGPFTRHLADVGNQSYRDLISSYIVSKTNSYDHYIGPYLDDVNLRIDYVSCGDEWPDGNNSQPVDPRTGRVVTTDDWQAYWVAFLHQIRESLPSTAKIVHNAPWYFLPIGDPEHAAQVRAADYVEMEFGFNEIDSVGGQYGWTAKMAYVDWVHSLGSHVISQEYDGGRAFSESEILYGLANYFLLTDGEDYFSIFDNADPDDSWMLYGSTLGEPLGARYQLAGVWRRDFEYGYVVVDPAAKVGQVVPQ